MLFRSSREKLLEKALTLYAGEHVSNYVLANGERALVASQASTELTILFVDIARVRSTGDGVDPARLSEWQHDYLGVVSESVLGNRGVLDTFVGDAASAWWNESASDNSERAIVAALAMVQGVRVLNERAAERNHPAVDLKIGVHRGVAAVGPYGSKDRLRYGIIGDAVNLAAQLCNISGSTEPASIVISHTVQQRLSRKFATVPLDAVLAKDRDMPLDAFALQP